MNTDRQPKPTPTRDPACCGTCAAIVDTPEQLVKAPGQDGDVCAPQEPVLPRRIKPEDVRVGMIIEQRNGVCIMRGRVVAVEDGVFQCEVAWLRTENEPNGWSLWLIEDAPAPVDPDAEAIEAMARVAHDQNCVEGDWDEHGEGTRQAWRSDARAALAALRETHDVTARAEQ